MVVSSLKLGKRCPLNCNFHRQYVSLSEQLIHTADSRHIFSVLADPGGWNSRESWS